jgi:glycine/D-amino acid oxidase-like deaminating enzyme/nitrite reductase/ring-hydroxylating ferredoxin subunit
MSNNTSTDPNLTSGSHHSFWIDSVEPIQYEKLKENISADVVIVGAGISGLSIAYTLSSRGHNVVVLDDGNVGSGETGRTTAHIVNALDDRYYEIERVFGEEGAKLAAESHTAAINYIEEIIKKENIACDFERVDGYLFLDASDKPESMGKEYEAAKKAGVYVERLEETPHLNTKHRNCIRFPNQAQFHPLKYLKGLSQAVVTQGGKIFTQTRVTKADEKGVETSDGLRVQAKHIVVATNSPFNNKFVMHMKQYPYRTYVIGATIKKGSLPKALWWDTGDFEANAEFAPYHYVRTQPYDEKFDLLIVGGEDHPTGLPESMEANEESSYGKLIGWTRPRFDIIDVVYKWSGQVLEPMDSLGYIGRNPMDSDNIYIVTGDSGNGMTHGTIAGMLIPDLVVGIENSWEKIYSPSRMHIFKTGKTLVKEFFGGLLDYFKHSPKHADDIRLSDIKSGDAKIVQLGKEKYGAYRDTDNNLHVVSATCTHAGCTVRWNSDEKSWDCPCHGSRYSFEGKVLNGPAPMDLVYYREASNTVELR